MKTMQFGRVPLPALAFGLLLIPAAARGQAKPQHDSAAALMGAATFKTYCASCHGKGAEGDGPLAAQLRMAPADLTRLSKRNGGKYPFDQVYQIIDGRKPVKGHGGPDMPVWGDAFLQSHDGYDEAKVKEKITQLTHFLASIQAPSEK